MLSPEALASKWVGFELDYFLGKRRKEELVLILRRSCELSEAVRDLPQLDFRSEREYDTASNSSRNSAQPPTRVCRKSVAKSISHSRLTLTATPAASPRDRPPNGTTFSKC